MLPLSKFLSGKDEQFHWSKVPHRPTVPLSKVLSGKGEQVRWSKVTNLPKGDQRAGPRSTRNSKILTFDILKFQILSGKLKFQVAAKS